MKFIFFILLLSLSFAHASTEASRGMGFTLKINKEASMSMSILIKNSKENDVTDLKNCAKPKFSHTLKCLSFHTASGAVEVPLSLVDLVDEDELAGDAAKLSKTAQKDGKETYSWGSVLTWKMDSAHFFYLIPEDRTYSIRLGPIPDSLLSNHDLQFSKVVWKFHD